jgi:hypothetical protein
MKPRKTRHDKGTIKANDRDINILTWIGDQYAARFDHVVEMARANPGPGANPDGISISAVRQMVDRWRRAEWVGYQQFLAGDPPWLWLTREGLAAFDLREYKAAPPAISRLHHIHAVNTVRLAIQDDEQEWISERMIRAGLYDLPQSEGETRHIPDAVLRTDDGDFVIEVELTQKKPDELYRKMHALIHAWDKEAFAYAYTGIWYFTPDKRIAKALEIARQGHAQRMAGKRAALVQIEVIEV